MYFRVVYAVALTMAFFVMYLVIADAIRSFGIDAADSTYDILKHGLAYALFILTIFIGPPKKYYFVILCSAFVLLTICNDLVGNWKFSATDKSITNYYIFDAWVYLAIAFPFFLVFLTCIFASITALTLMRKGKLQAERSV